MSRLGLACACAFAGFAYGALLDLSVMVTYGGEQSLDRYLALSARGLPFNIAHAAGNFAIALAAGPALVRMISRFRERLEFTWTSGAAPARAGAVGVLALVVSLLVLASGPGGPQDARARQEAASGTSADGRAWLERAQNRDGGFGTAPGSSSNAGMTGWAMLGLEAAGRNPLDLRRDGNSPVDYLRGRAERLNSSADLERTVLALAGAGISPYDFGGQNLVAELRAKRDGDGSFDGNVNSTSFAVFALRSVSAPASELERSATWMRRAQNRDGGWGFRRGTASDADSTGAALQALDAAGGGGSAASKGVRYLRGAQLGDGGFPLASGGASNSQSTAWAAQGLVASGVAPASVTSAGSSPLDYLAARQAPDGHYRYSAATDQTPVWVTSQALLAVNRRAFPLGRVPKVGEPGALPPPAESFRRPEEARAERSAAREGARQRGRMAATGAARPPPGRAMPRRAMPGRPAPTGRPRLSSPWPTFRPEPSRRAAPARATTRPRTSWPGSARSRSRWAAASSGTGASLP